MYSEPTCHVPTRRLGPSHLASKPWSSVLASSIECLSGLVFMRWTMVICSETCRVLAFRKHLHLRASLVHSMRVSSMLIHELVRHLPSLFLHQVLLYAHHWLHVRALCQVLSMFLQELRFCDSRRWPLVCCEPSLTAKWMSGMCVSLIAMVVALSFIVAE